MEDKRLDKLEEFVQNNRSQLDDETPSDQVWQSIDQGMGAQQNGPGFKAWLWKAAAVIFFVTSAYLLVDKYQSRPTEPVQPTLALVEETGFKDVESYYISLIGEKKEQIYSFETRNVEVDESFERDLYRLDAMYQVLKEELAGNASPEVIDALTLNLLVRIDILNEQLHDLEELQECQSTTKKEEKAYDV
ncbi:MAG: hypothetical protein AAFX87_02530 [Bacteroidota bacterium]